MNCSKITIVLMFLACFANELVGACNNWRSAGTYEPAPTCFAVCQARCKLFFNTAEFECPISAKVFAQCKCCGD
uniref:Uncharacterized protein n=1 Tax=Trichogramma kaykai TaxID=54128 RepID=A0ABD2WV10_9HYME